MEPVPFPAFQHAPRTESLKYSTRIPHSEVASIPSNSGHQSGEQIEVEINIRQFEENPGLRFTKQQFSF
ncbi:MAG: hypothetical protein AAB676_02625 [Verrucomicrobiota bacterium]